MTTRSFEPARRRVAGRWRTQGVRLLRRGVGLLLALALTFPVTVAIVHVAGVRLWPFELLHHFVAQAGMIAVAIAIAALLAGAPRVLLPAAGLALFFAVVWATAPLPAPTLAIAGASPAQGAPAPATRAAVTPARPLSLVTNNVYIVNRRLDELTQWLRTRPADVVVLQEVSPRLIERLRRADDGYPYRLVAEDSYAGYEDAEMFGFGGERSGADSRNGWRSSEATVVLSVWPIIERRMPDPQTRAWQMSQVRLDMGDRLQPWVVVVHPPSPVVAGNLPLRDRILRELATTVSQLDGPVIVAGDFNATPYTPAFRAFAEEAGLASFGHFPPTYPNRLGDLGLPIDHVLVRDARLVELQALPSIGSDHRPLSARILLPAAG